MARVFDVAELFIQLASQSGDDSMTNLKLNKMLYYAQGTYLSRTGEPLFPNKMEAWPHGPVVPDIYHRYKICGRYPIEFGGVEINPARFKEEELNAIMDVMREFGPYTGIALANFTHRPGTPWSIAEAEGSKVLENATIKEYFTEHPVPRLSERIRAPKVKELPKEWYNPDEDAEWEAYL